MLEQLQAYFKTGKTLDLSFRLAQLETMKKSLKDFEARFFASLAQDLGKSAFEAYETELGMVYAEINEALAHLKKWARPRRVKAPLTQFPSSGRVFREPVGVVLVIAPWNYPVQLALSPLVASIAAGNCTVVKPSELAPATSAVLAAFISQTFSPGYVFCQEGGVKETTELLAQKFDHIFFTGGQRVGKIVMHAAAEYLTPVTLELGGKSPCIVDATANLPLAAKRICWGKFLNAGQTCVAPDYLLVQRSVRDKLIEHIRQCVTKFYGPHPLESGDYPKMINQAHLCRLLGLLEGEPLLFGGETDGEKLAPTLLLATLESPLMQDEIFGPILPVLTFDELDEAIFMVQKFSKPLALYLFSQSKAAQKKILRRLPFGGGCVNDTVSHLACSRLPFGGVGASGMGAYHGETGFLSLSHEKSVLKKGLWPDISVRYAPYGGKLPLLRKLLK